jgi:hypothetical protein
MRAIDLTLPPPERRWAETLAAPWRDLLYSPGPGFRTPLEPGLFRAAMVILPAGAPAVRITSLVVPAFSGELCRLRLEPLADLSLPIYGSFFEPTRKGRIWRMPRDPREPAARPPEVPDWSYEGPPLGAAFTLITRVRVLREHARGGSGDGAFAWTADRGLVLTGERGAESLLLALPDQEEHTLFLPAIGPYRVLADPSVPETPGASVRELLGYGDREKPFEVTVSLEAV